MVDHWLLVEETGGAQFYFKFGNYMNVVSVTLLDANVGIIKGVTNNAYVASPIDWNN
jgi:hypothetical protein